MRSLGVAAAIAAAAQLALAGTILAASGWSLTADTSAMDIDDQRNVVIRATDTDGSGDIGCVWVVIPDEFDVNSATVLGTTGDTPWTATISNSGPGRTVKVRNPDGGGKLKEGDWVQFRVSVTGRDAGSHPWTGDASAGEDCKDPFLASINLAMTVSAAPTPAPTATPAATPVPTATPAATPTPTATSAATPTPSPAQTAGPTPARTATPTAGNTAGPRPSGPPATPSPTAGATARPTGGAASAWPSPSGSTTGAASVAPTESQPPASVSADPATPVPSASESPMGLGSTSGEDGGLGGGSILYIPGANGWSVELDASEFERSASFGAFVWMVPGFVMALPVLLLFLVIGAQVFGATIFVPLTRRLFGRRRARDP